VKAIVDLAHGLGLTATAEGVETVEQLRFLRAIRCDVAQGYLVARPLEPARLPSWRADFEKRWSTLVA
jgi:EAL domain-containing protein (putative c-di-GMP-specific phosphodiesterase class I)